MTLCPFLFSQLGGGQPVAAAHLSAQAVKRFLTSYDKSTAVQRQRRSSSKSLQQMRGGESVRLGAAKEFSSNSPILVLPVENDEELLGSETAAIDPWQWLVDNGSGNSDIAGVLPADGAFPPPPLLSLRPDSAEALAERAAVGSSKDSAAIAVQRAGTTEPAGSWVLRPAWSASMTDAIEAVAAAQVRLSLLEYCGRGIFRCSDSRHTLVERKLFVLCLRCAGHRRRGG